MRLLPPPRVRAMAPAAAAGFLRPSQAEQEAIKARREDAARLQKARAKVQAAERKRKREEERARVATIEEQIKANRPSKIRREPAIDAVAEAKVRAYLDDPPYHGRCGKADNERLKQLCGSGPGRLTWCKERTLWSTKAPDRIEPLVNTGKWKPFGLDEEWLPYLIVLANRRAEDVSARAEAVAAVKRDASLQAIVEEAAAAGGSAHLNVEERAAASQAREVDASMTPATAAEAAACARLGFVEATICRSRLWPELGPRAGMSGEGRLLRHVAVVESDVRCDYERPPWLHTHYFDEARMGPIVDAAIAQAATALNARALLELAPSTS